MTQDMPVGPIIRWNWTTNEDLQEVLKLKLSTEAHISRLAYYFFSTHEHSAHIKTLFNTGKEIRISGFYCERVGLELKHSQQEGLIEYVTGFKVKHHWECQILSSLADKKAYNAYLPNFYRYNKNKEVNTNTMLTAVQKGDFFGGVEVDIDVPQNVIQTLKRCAPSL